MVRYNTLVQSLLQSLREGIMEMRLPTETLEYVVA
jgi:hypothetical protein